MVLSPKAKGIACMIASAFGFALMALCVRLCDDYGGAVSSFQKSFFRNLLAFALTAGVFLRTASRGEGAAGRGRFRLDRASWGFLLTRSALGTAGIFLNFYALGLIPIAEGQTLNKTAPFFTLLTAWLVLKERVSRRQAITLVLAFLGVLLIAKPGFAGSATIPLLCGLAGGVCAGGAYTCVRALRQRGVASALIILFFSAFSCLASVPFLIFRYDPVTLPQLFILFGAGLGAAIGQFGITLAYGYAAPREIAVYDYTNILFTAAFGFFFFAQVPDLWSFLGFGAIIGAAFLLHR